MLVKLKVSGTTKPGAGGVLPPRFVTTTGMGTAGVPGPDEKVVLLGPVEVDMTTSLAFCWPKMKMVAASAEVAIIAREARAENAKRTGESFIS